MSKNPNVTRFFSKPEKDMLYEKVMEQVRWFIRGHDPHAVGLAKDPRMYCSIAAAVLTVELKAYGVDSFFEAGSAHWRMVPPSKDDGVSPTHFSHEFHADEVARHLIAGRFPEIHCWVAIPRDTHENSEIIDFTVGVLPEKVKVLQGYRWLMPEPPKYLWDTVANVRKLDWHYVGSSKAASIAGQLARQAALEARMKFISRG